MEQPRIITLALAEADLAEPGALFYPPLRQLLLQHPLEVEDCFLVAGEVLLQLVAPDKQVLEEAVLYLLLRKITRQERVVLGLMEAMAY